MSQNELKNVTTGVTITWYTWIIALHNYSIDPFTFAHIPTLVSNPISIQCLLQLAHVHSLCDTVCWPYFLNVSLSPLPLPLVLVDDASNTDTKEVKSRLARQANRVRKQILDEVRTGQLCGKPLQQYFPLNNDTVTTSDEFRKTVSDAFLMMVKDVTWL